MKEAKDKEARTLSPQTINIENSVVANDDLFSSPNISMIAPEIQ